MWSGLEGGAGIPIVVCVLTRTIMYSSFSLLYWLEVEVLEGALLREFESSMIDDE
jgi:hypothetical protein